MGFLARKDHRLLVTGCHRSGTTWVGRILGSHPELKYILEPLNVTHGPAAIRAVNKHCYRYLCRENQRLLLKPLQGVLHGECQARDCEATHHRHRGTLIKDPFALFSVPWFAHRLGFRSIITVRHPVSLVGSLHRLGWHFDHRHLTEQPLLMRDWLAPFRRQLEAAIARPGDLIGEGCLLWRMIYSTAWQIACDVPGTLVLRHEDLSRNPWLGFYRLFNQLDLSIPASLAHTIQALTSSQNPSEASSVQEHEHTIVALDSLANLGNWRRRLSPADVERIVDLTADVAQLYYSAAETAEFIRPPAATRLGRDQLGRQPAIARFAPLPHIPGRLSLVDLGREFIQRAG